jgi:hypothetical protein
VRRSLRIEEIVASACSAAISSGLKEWKDIRAVVERDLKAHPPADRQALMNELKLMVDREEDQSHKARKH